MWKYGLYFCTWKMLNSNNLFRHSRKNLISRSYEEMMKSLCCSTGQFGECRRLQYQRVIQAKIVEEGSSWIQLTTCPCSLVRHVSVLKLRETSFGTLSALGYTRQHTGERLILKGKEITLSKHYAIRTYEECKYKSTFSWYKQQWEVSGPTF
jgi:hypothetical protein